MPITPDDTPQQSKEQNIAFAIIGIVVIIGMYIAYKKFTK